ncbi:IS200/IS605 family transposase [Planctomicrobium piriforme]|uniref:REP element-mobilizing transposase RayT n=1 Tax=Planctomicrobium piriforme TaxID=1576369 RepID=A0A1I3Q2Q7_9PLAN|nr:IS200/IS605 family transposase [Planctomicrobium piriforme]SFJ27902.1 REP element-mobilizing transposase RayT [Planctomicrobium piriforme]
MSQSLTRILVHLVYSTKDRRQILQQDHWEKLWAYQAGIYQDLESPAIIIGGVADHVHALFNLSKNHSLKTIVEEVKKGSSKWLKTVEGRYSTFHWQAGYGAFSVSASNEQSVRSYIERQAEHHAKQSFEDELRALFTRHNVEFDERYVWN